MVNIMQYTIICVRNGVNSENFTGTIDELSAIFNNTLIHGFNVQQEYNKRKISKKIPTSIESFINYLNDCTYNATSCNEKVFKLLK